MLRSSSVTFHIEAVADPSRTIAQARGLGLGVGVAFNPETSVEHALGASAGADFVLCMSIHPGYSGQRFVQDALERVAFLRRRLPAEVLVQVDGGIDETNAADLAGAGARLIVSGARSSISSTSGARTRTCATTSRPSRLSVN